MKDAKKYQLTDICLKIVDCEHKTAPVQQNGFPSIRTPNIGKGRLLLEEVNRVSEETWQEWTKREIPKYNDLIFAREAPLGNVAMVPKNIKLCLGQRTVLLRPDINKVIPRFLCYLLLSPKIQHTMHSRGGGATVPHLNVKEIRQLPLELPPLPTQQKIAHFLSAYDDLIENNLKRIKLLEEMAQITYEEWFVRMKFPGHEQAVIDSETGLPEGWRVKKLEEEVELIKDTVLPGSIDISTRYIGLEHIPRKSFTLSKHGVAGNVSSLKIVVKRGDILFGKIRPYFHKIGIALTDCITSTDVIVVRSNNTMGGIILQVMFSDSFVSAATQSSNGTKMPRANWNVLKKYEFIVPSDPVLRKYIDLSDSNVSSISNLVNQNQLLKEARDILLPRLMTGMIDVDTLEVSDIANKKTTQIPLVTERQA